MDKTDSKDEQLPQLRIRMPQELIDRINALAALKTKGRDEYVNELFEKLTARLKPIQSEIRAEDEAEAKRDKSVLPSRHEGGKAEVRRSSREAAESQATPRKKNKHSKETQP